MDADPRATMKAIDIALGKALADSLPAISISLAWPAYRDLLAIKGVEWEPTQTGREARHDDRPLKTYRGFPLYLTDGINIVEGRLPNGAISGWSIANSTK